MVQALADGGAASDPHRRHWHRPAAWAFEALCGDCVHGQALDSTAWARSRSHYVARCWEAVRPRPVARRNRLRHCEARPPGPATLASWHAGMGNVRMPPMCPCASHMPLKCPRRICLGLTGFAQVCPVLARFVSMSANFRPIWATFGLFLTEFGPLQRHLGPILTNIGQLVEIVAICLPKLAQVGPILAQFPPNSAND